MANGNTKGLDEKGSLNPVEGLHEYVAPPVAFMTALGPPVQTDWSGPASATTGRFTVKLTDVISLQPNELMIVSVN